MAACKIGNSEILCINVARWLQQYHPNDKRSRAWAEIDEFSVVQCEWCLNEYAQGRMPSFDDVKNHQ